jgi:triosephosphate isomerase (TIM)
MAIQKQPLIIGNWKMNPLTSVEAVTLAKTIMNGVKKMTDVSIGITPPTLFMSEVSKAIAKSNLRLGVQDVQPGPVGAFTGAVSPAMCAPYDVTYTIVGHSEVRARGVSDEQINASTLMTLKAKMTPVVCIGEHERDDAANFYSVIETQITTALASVPVNRYKDVVIAYEPIWAIGTGTTPTPSDVQEMKLFIQKILTKLAGRTAAAAATIIYGGSVNGENAKALYHDGGVHGFLVGGASLKPEEFIKIIQNIS